jgi:prepilin-type N-terminal cleavage/methylation domain-containing protein
MNRNMRRKTCGFTLVELVVVIAVLGILISLVFTAGSYVFGEQESKVAKMHINVIRLALDEYKLREGDYPEVVCEASGFEDEMLRGNELLKSLCYAEEKDEIFGAGNIKLLPLDKLLTGTMEDNDQVVYLEDPWESPYIYAYPRPDGRAGYLLFSRGPDLDCADYTEDDVSDDNLIDSDNIGADSD